MREPSDKDYEPHRETILRLVEAIMRRRRCTVEYQAPASRSAKAYAYDPYRLLTITSGLYCVGRVPPHENLTTLAVDRIRSLRITDHEFEIAPAFDADRHRRESFGIIWERPMDVTVRFSADQAPFVRERVWHPTQKLRELRDGRIELSFRAGGVFEITRWVLGWGDAAEVIRPAKLRHGVWSALHDACAIYERGDVDTGSS